MRVRCFGVAIAFCVLSGAPLVATPDPPASPASLSWPEWQRFVERFMQADGRIIDLTFDRKSTSEGQSYALFFALVADDRKRFDAILRWTSDNLADGQLGEKLPGWLWGLRDDGGWGIKDANPASDADLWIAYTLLEAGRLWHSPGYTALGHQLLALISAQEIIKAEPLGRLLLPGPVGFVLANDRFRINPSYLPGFMFRYLAMVDPAGPWASVWDSYLRLAPRIYAHGVAPDIVVVTAQGEVVQDTERAPSGSYDAIRVYLWAGMSGDGSKELIRLLAPFAALIRDTGAPPEKVNPATGAPLQADYSPIGYAGAVLPFLSALRDEKTLMAQQGRLRIDAARARLGGSTNYYDQVLVLFGQGWHDGRYAFDEQGRLRPSWSR